MAKAKSTRKKKTTKKKTKKKTAKKKTTRKTTRKKKKKAVVKKRTTRKGSGKKVTPKKTPKSHEKYRDVLVDRRNELIQSFRSQAEAAPNSSETGSMGDSADQANTDYMTELFGVFLEQQAGSLEQVEYALAKFDEGTYGQCESCGDKILAKRLKAIPWARYCRECQEKIDRSKAVSQTASGSEAWSKRKKR